MAKGKKDAAVKECRRLIQEGDALIAEFEDYFARNPRDAWGTGRGCSAVPARDEELLEREETFPESEALPVRASHR